MQVKLKDIKDGDIYINPYTGQPQITQGSAKVFSNGFVEISIKGTDSIFAINNENMLVHILSRPEVSVAVEVVESKSLEDQIQYHTELLRLHATTLSVLTGEEVTVKTKIKQETSADHLHLGGVDDKVTTAPKDDTIKTTDSRFSAAVKKLVDEYLDSKAGTSECEFIDEHMSHFTDISVYAREYTKAQKAWKQISTMIQKNNEVIAGYSSRMARPATLGDLVKLQDQIDNLSRDISYIKRNMEI